MSINDKLRTDELCYLLLFVRLNNTYYHVLKQSQLQNIKSKHKKKYNLLLLIFDWKKDNVAKHNFNGAKICNLPYLNKWRADNA